MVKKNSVSHVLRSSDKEAGCGDKNKVKRKSSSTSCLEVGEYTSERQINKLEDVMCLKKAINTCRFASNIITPTVSCTSQRLAYSRTKHVTQAHARNTSPNNELVSDISTEENTSSSFTHELRSSNSHNEEYYLESGKSISAEEENSRYGSYRLGKDTPYSTLMEDRDGVSTDRAPPAGQSVVLEYTGHCCCLHKTCHCCVLCQQQLILNSQAMALLDMNTIAHDIQQPNSDPRF